MLSGSKPKLFCKVNHFRGNFPNFLRTFAKRLSRKTFGLVKITGNYE